MHLTKSFLKMDVLVAMTCFGLAGCMVGPDFHAPASPTHSKRYTATPIPAKTVHTNAPGNSGKTQHFISTQEIPSQWWELFHSKEINMLVKRGIAHSPTLAGAYASLRQAQETLNAQIGNSLFPAFSAQAGAQRQLFNSAGFGGTLGSSIFNLYNANVNVSYTLDVFGGARRQIESLSAQVDYQQFELIAAYLTLTSNIVTTAVTAATYESMIKTTHALIKNQEEQLAIIKKQFGIGGVSEENIQTQRTLVEQTKATLPPLEQNLAKTRHALDVLIGNLPDQPVPSIDLNKLNLPAKLPVSMPSSLVRQRPDIRASEALLHSASANIGVATANLFPQFTLSGVYGWQSAVPSTLFGTNTNMWSIATQIAQPIFQGGALLAQRRAAIDAYQLAFNQYKQTVLLGFQNVADTLRALQNDARTLQALNLATKAAYKNYQLSKDQYHMGGVSYLNLLVAQLQYETTILQRVQAQAARYNDTVALFQALGGGWWNQTWCVKECLYEAT